MEGVEFRLTTRGGGHPMITVNARPDETLAAYLARCLDTAAHEVQIVCGCYEKTVVIVSPSMSIQELADEWVEASRRSKRRRRA
jgi:hypothetical protein